MRTEAWKGHKIRFVEKDGEHWAVAKDITDALGFRDVHNATMKLKEKYKGRAKVSTLGGMQDVIVLNEKGIYRLIMRSNKKEAEVFQDWVYEMLKTLRQATGLEGFEIFRMLDKEHQKEAMSRLSRGLTNPVRVDFIKANTIANKTVSNRHGHKKMLKKGEMTPAMLVDREAVLDSAVELMTVKDKYGLDISVSAVLNKQ